jgi:photosystem II stability/assembly factor-like uncharacterized protein
VYPGVDLVYYGHQQQLEYDFIVAPGVNPASIRLAFEGAQSIELDAQGDLVLHTRAGDVHQHKPVVYQEVDGAKREIPSRYMLKDAQRVGFQVDAYDTGKPLVIDPVLLYSTFLGGNGIEEGFGIAVDAAGNAYVAGRTMSFDFPVLNPAQSFGDGVFSDAFVSKLNRDGSALIYSTFIGGSITDVARGIAVDTQGSAYLTGYTFSPDFPLMNPLQAVLGGQDDPFVTKLSPGGSALLYSTYLGGASYEAGLGIAVNAAGEAHVTGYTFSHDFPLMNPVQSTKQGHQAFRSSDGGAHWSASDSGLDGARLNDLAIDPAHPETLYSATEQGVFKSTDSGDTWHAVNTGLEGTGDSYRLAVDPSHTSTVFVGTDFGLFKSTNGGASWAPVLTDGAPLIRSIAIDPIHPSTIYASANGTPFKSTDGGASWAAKPIIGEFGIELSFVRVLAVNPVNSSIVYAGTFFGVYKSTDGGEHWNPTVTDPGTGFIEDLVINPLQPSVLYASTGFSGIYQSTDAGNHWNAVNTGLPALSFKNILTLAIDPLHPSVLYAGTEGGGLFKTSNGGAEWSAVNTGLTNRTVTGIAIDPTSTSRVYVVTSSLGDAFVTKLNPSGSARLYSTYLGGDEDDGGAGIALDRSGQAYLAGRTISTNFPTMNPLQASFASLNNATYDAFVTKLDATGSSLAYSTYLGGTGDEQATGIAVDRSGNAYVTGVAALLDPSLPMTFPITPNAFQTTLNGAIDAFVSKLTADGSSLAYSTYLGGRNFDYANAIAVNPSGQAFVTGQTLSDDFPLVRPTQNQRHSFVDAFVTRLNPTGSSLIFSTYLGGDDASSFSLSDQGHGIAVDSASSAYVVGTTDSPDFPTTPDALQTFMSGLSDAFITKIGSPPASIKISGRVLLDGAGLGGVTVTLKNKAGSVLQTTTTRVDGSYSFTVAGGGNYTVTPSKPGYVFNPPSRSYTNVGTNLPMQNFEAILSTFTIFIAVDNNVQGVRITLTGSRNGVCITDGGGSCQFTGLPAGGNYTVTPSARGTTFKPSSKTFNNLSQNQSVTFIAGLSISGRITGFGGIGISGVTVKMNDTRIAVTDSNGNYMFTNLQAHNAFILIPMKGGMNFRPTVEVISSLRASQTVNFQALVSITGKVRLEGTTTGISGVKMTLTGSRSTMTTTNSEGIYRFNNLPAAGNYTVTPMKPGYTFHPPSRTFTDLRVSQGLRTSSFDGMP